MDYFTTKVKVNQIYSKAYNSPVFKKIRSKYGALREPHLAKINELTHAQDIIWEKSIEFKLLYRIFRLPRSLPFLCFWGGLLVLIIGTNTVGFFSVITLIIVFIYLFGVVLCILQLCRGALSNYIKKKVVLHNQKNLRFYEERANNATQELALIDTFYDLEWEKACETFQGYPPDWAERCKAVKSRDGNTCTSCGYPVGFKSCCRELHVHHKQSISENGTNKLDNLITLCHICHKKIGPKHWGVRKLHKR
jgi:hypothetical protein